MSASSPREVADRQCGQRSEKRQYVSDSHSDRSASNLCFLMIFYRCYSWFQDVLLQYRGRTHHAHTWCKFGGRMIKKRSAAIWLENSIVGAVLGHI